MQEMARGPELRMWYQETGLLPTGQDFADKRQGSSTITVKAAHTFITDYYKGQTSDSKALIIRIRTPHLCRSGRADSEWEKARRPHIWKDAKLKKAGEEFGLSEKIISVLRQAEVELAQGSGSARSAARWVFQPAVFAAPAVVTPKYSCPYVFPLSSHGQG